MYRVYLDWNVMAALKTKSLNHVSDELLDLLESNRDTLIAPFSSTHIQDLIKGSDNPDHVKLIEKDLDLINSVTNGHFIDYDIQSDLLSPKIVDAFSIFESAKEAKEEPLFDPESFLRSFAELGTPETGEFIMNKWKSTPTGIDFSKLDLQDGSNEVVRNFLSRAKKEDNVLNLMLDLIDFYNDIKVNPETYSNMQNLFRRLTNLDPKVMSNSKDPINEINKILKTFNLESDINSLGSINSTPDNKYLASSMIKFAIEFSNLDLSGYHPDKLTNKNTYENFSNDVHHVYYGGTCDYFITNESKLIHKANVMYRKYNIDCVALKPIEFIAEIADKLNYKLTVDSFIDRINYTLTHHLKKEIKEHEFAGGKLKLYDSPRKLLGYFNYLYTVEYLDDRRTIILRLVPKCFGRFSYYTEIRSIIHKLYSVLGSDIYNLGEPKIEDYSNSANPEYFDRAWVLDGYFCMLALEDDKLHFRLEMNKLTQAFLDSLDEASIEDSKDRVQS